MSTDTEAILAGVRTWAENNDVPVDSIEDEEIVVTLPGEKKLKTVASLVVGEQALSVSAFVIRNADENHCRFYQFLLRRNLRMRLLAYSIDTSGDVYVGGRIPLRGTCRRRRCQVRALGRARAARRGLLPRR